MVETTEPRITQKTSIQLMGCVYYGDPFHAAKEWSTENEVGKLWQRFMTLANKYSGLLSKIGVNNHIGYEIHIEPEEYKTTKNYYLFVGVEVSNTKEVPLEMFVKILPETRYIQFTTKISHQEQGEQVFKEWMPQHRYTQAYPYIIESYDSNRFKSVDDGESEIDWYIPVKEA
jgi:AraC family transcriptional regulator